MTDTWPRGTNWIRHTGSWIGRRYDDGVEITAVAVSPIVTFVDSNRVTRAIGNAGSAVYNHNPMNPMRLVTGPMSYGTAPAPTNFQYLPPVYAQAQQTMARPVPRQEATPGETEEARVIRERANARARLESRVEANRVTAEAHEATGRYQEAAIDIATLPAWALMGPVTGTARGSFQLAGRVVAREAARQFIPRLALRLAAEFGLPLVADLGMREGAATLYNRTGPSVHYNSTVESLVDIWRRWRRVPDEERRLDTAQIAERDHFLAAGILSRANATQERVAMLYRNGRATLSIEDLDRDGDGVLTAADEAEIRRIIDNPAIANELFAEWGRQVPPISFNNYRYREQSGRTALTDAEAETLLRGLFRDGRTTLTIEDLDRNGDGTLTAEDAAEVRRILGNNELADAIFADLHRQGIHFNNYRYQAQGALTDEAAALDANLRRLIGDGRTTLTIADFDRDGDGILTAADQVEIRNILGNDADAVFAQLQTQGIHFNNMPVSEVTDNPQPALSSGPGQPGGNERGFLERILASVADFLERIFPSRPQRVAPGGGSPVQPNNPAGDMLSMPLVPPPLFGGTGINQNGISQL